MPEITVPVSSPLGADPSARVKQRIAAHLALDELERAVQRIAQRLHFSPTLRRTIPRRSRRSAWLPSPD